MSSFYYHKPHEDEPKLAVKCDGCKTVLWTDREGQEFPYHITKDAKEAGWSHRKINGKWLDFCPECTTFLHDKDNQRRDKIRQEVLGRI